MFIVLKVFDAGNLACFLDEEHGKFIAHYSMSKVYMKLVPGSLVRGDLMRGSGRYARLNNISLDYLGLVGGKTSQFFLYFLLELAYLFLPQHDAAPGSFFFLRSSIESCAVSWCDEQPSFGVVLAIFFLEELGFSAPQQLTIQIDIQHMLDTWSGWVELEAVGAELTLPLALVLKYDSLWGDSWSWISDCLQEHPQFKKIEKKWLGLLPQNTGGIREKV